MDYLCEKASRMKRDYFEGTDVAVIVCAKDGTILDMNQKSRKTILKPGRP